VRRDKIDVFEAGWWISWYGNAGSIHTHIDEGKSGEVRMVVEMI
jgi:hypothetical protein